MANNNFFVFNENENNIMSVADYEDSSVRLNGVVSGLAESMLHNRLYRQVSTMVAALGQVIADGGQNASDDDLAALVTAIKNVLATKSSGAIGVNQGGTGASSFTSNAVLVGNGSSAISTKPTANGAAYATSTNGALTFGTLPVAQGGTGKTTLTSNAILTGNGTNAIGQVATAKGAAYATAANGSLTFGTLPIGQGGTGATTFTSGALLKGNGTSAIQAGPVIGTDTTKFLRNDGTWQVPSGTFSLSKATTSTLGGVKLYSNTAQTVAPASVSSTASRTYAVQLNSSDQAVVNVPWENTTYTSQAAASGGTAVSLVTTGEKYTWNNKQNALTFDGTYNASTNKAATVSTVTGTTSTKLNRSDASVNTANTAYTTPMARAIYANTTDMEAGVTSLTNGTIYLYYEA